MPLVIPCSLGIRYFILSIFQIVIVLARNPYIYTCSLSKVFAANTFMLILLSMFLRCFQPPSTNGNQFVELSGHVVVCLVSEDDSPIIGLSNLVRPLRSRSIPRNALKPIVFLGNPEYIRQEWPYLAHYPLIYTFKVGTLAC